jgi:hypothetical protein
MKLAKLEPSRAEISAHFMRRFAGRFMREVGNHRSARTIGIALVAGLVAFEAALAFGTGAIGIPGLFLFRIAAESADPQVTAEAPAGGESVVAKPAGMASEESAEPDSPAGEPRLDGLADIPLQDWILPRPPPSDGKAFGESAKPRKEDLPWDAIEPVPFDSAGPVAAHEEDATASIPQGSAPEAPMVLTAALAELPASGLVEGWVKSKVMEIKGEERARPLYHFEFWLEAPDDVKRRLTAVSYEFNTPAVRPQSQISSERVSGFRVSTGGLACADRVTVTLKFNDGRTQQVAVDGCRLLS